MAEQIRVDADIHAQASPLAKLLPSIPEALYTIAPEHLDALRDALSGAALAVSGEPRWIARYEFAPKTIRLSMRTFEIVWCASFAYLALHDLVWIPGLSAGRSQADLTSDPRVARAMELLRWALQAADNEDSAPRDVVDEARLDALRGAADELSLCAIAFVLHHELAHHRLLHNHQAVDDAASVDRERDADREAASWMLGGVARGTPEYRKRLLGAAMATAYLTTLALERGKLAAKNHPRPFDRLFNLLDERTDGPEDRAWCFAMGAVKLHLDHLEISASGGPFDDCRDALNAYVEQLAELAARE
jgi:hypothetical protein